MKNSIVLLLCCACLFSCETSPSGGVTTFPNSVRGEVKSESDVVVTLSKISISNSSIVAKSYNKTTEDGKYEFENIEPGKYIAVYTDDNGELAINSDIEVTAESDLDLEIKNRFDSHYLRGVVLQSNATSVIIPGIQKSVTTDDGVYVIKAPSGTVPVFVQGEKTLILDLHVQENSRDTIGVLDISLTESETKLSEKFNGSGELYTVSPIEYKVGEEPEHYNYYYMNGIEYENSGENSNTNYGSKIVLDDFEHNKFPESLIGKYTQGWWYQSSDSISSHSFSLQTEQSNSYLSIQTNLSALFYGPFASTGITFGSEAEYDLSLADSVEFKIRGNGKVQFSIEMDPVNYTENDFPYVDIELTENWKQYKIAINDLAQPGPKWSEMSHKVKTMEFTFADFVGTESEIDLNCDIDDVIITGVSISDIIK